MGKNSRKPSNDGEAAVAEVAPEARAVLEAAKQPSKAAVAPRVAEKPKQKPRPARPLDHAVHGRLAEILRNQRINNQFILRYRKGEGYVIQFKNWIRSPLEGQIRRVLLNASKKVLNGEHLIVNF